MAIVKVKEALQLSLQARDSGSFSKAESLANAVLKKLPGHPRANLMMGEMLSEKGQFEASLKFFEVSMAASPANSQLLNSYVNALVALRKFADIENILIKAHQEGLPFEVIASLFTKVQLAGGDLVSQAYLKARKTLLRLYEEERATEFYTLCEANTKKYPYAYEMWNFLGIATQRIGRIDQALDAFGKATRLNPSFAEGFSNLGVILKSIGRFEEAIKAYRTALKINPSNAETCLNFGLLLQHIGDLFQAEFFFKKALSLKPASFEAHNCLGNIMYYQKNFREAELAFLVATNIKPEYTDALFNLGTTYRKLGRLQDAYKTFLKLIKFNSEDFKAHLSMAVVLRLQMKFGEALAACDQGFRINARSSEAYMVLGSILLAQNKIDSAIEAYQTASSISPKSSNSLLNLALIFVKKGEYGDAIILLKKALEITPNLASAKAFLIYLNRCVCDWEYNLKIEDDVSSLGIATEYVAPFTLLSCQDNSKNDFLRSRNFANAKFDFTPIKFLTKRSKQKKAITLGYFSADFKHHPVALLMAGVFKHHNRGHFRVLGYNIGSGKGDSVRKKLESAFDELKDVNKFSDEEIANIARKDNVDIAIDLTGYTHDCRTGIFAFRAAPIQINYLGYPGSMGADFIDYIVADHNLIPEEYRQYYSEKIIYLPHQYQAQNVELKISTDTPTRSALGLPEKGFVFCAINNTYKITSREFDIWMRLLKKVDGSTLWLLESNKWARENLQKQAWLRGVASERLVFAKTVSHESYLAQFRQADLYLDTFNYNAGATASNVLWAGLPLLTKQGRSYTARMASSLLNALGLPELITIHESAYEDLAVNLAQNPGRLASLKTRLNSHIKSMPLFDTKLFTRHLEEGYLKAYQRFIDGKEPDTIIVNQ